MSAIPHAAWDTFDSGLALFTVVLSWFLTALIRRWAVRADLIDRPNERSSHKMPTPRGGGVAIVCAFFGALIALWLSDRAAATLTFALLSSGLPVAIVGFLDDRKPLPARWRFLVHTASAMALLWALRQIPPLMAFGRELDLGWSAPILALLYLVWMTNLYNFMDGIDGIAGVQAVTVALGGAYCSWLASAGASSTVSIVLACASAGFLVWNYPPARIFMGDAGSGFLGITIGALAIWSSQDAPQLLWSWTILMGCFVVDATVTLARRVAKGESFHVPHRTHAYQYASRRLGRHLPVTLGCAAINLFWLLPWAVGAAARHVDGTVALLMAYLPLVVLVFRLRAGDRTAQGE